MNRFVFTYILSLLIFNAIAQNNCLQLEKLISEGYLLEAEELFNSSKDCNDPLLMGELYLRKGRIDIATTHFTTALNQASQDSEEKAQALNGLGLALWASGDNFTATEYIRQALLIREKQTNVNPEKIAASYNDLGLVSSNLDDALRYYNEALKVYENLDDRTSKIAQLKSNIGIINRSLGYLINAESNFSEALEIWSTLYVEAHPNKAFVLLNLGQTYLKMQRPEQALQYYKQGLANYISVYGDNHPDIAYTYNLIGNVYYEEGSFPEALENYQYALIANSINFNNPSLDSNPKASDYLNANTLLSSLYFKAQALEDYHYAFTKKYSDLKLSLSTLQSCDTLIDNIRQIQTNEQDKIKLGELAVQVYESGVRLCYDMAEVSLRKEPLYEQCFNFCEKSKSAVLLEAISDVSAKNFANIPTSLLEDEKTLKTDIDYYERLIASRTTTDSSSRIYQAKLFSLKQEYQYFTTALEKKYPRYFNLKYSISIPSIESLQSKLKESEAIVSYFLADRFNRIYIFYITNSKFEVYNAPQTENLNRYLTGYRNSIYFKDDKTYKVTGEGLHKILFPFRIAGKTESLVIIPAQRLGTIPFEALLTSKVKDIPIDYTSAEYLVNEYAISYQPSVILFYQQLEQHKKNNSKRIMLCAPVHFKGLSTLLGTEKEVNNIAEALNLENWETAVFTGPSATEDVVKTNDLLNYNIIHFATHGYVDELRPALSQIFLQKDEQNDGNLYSGEIYNLKMKASLVTLSACETGLGKISKGEGIIGLSRALSYAGAENIIVSLWNVGDNSTSDLMTKFYTHISSLTYKQSLRKAKLSMIASPEYAHPYYWAPFILIGE